MLGVYYPRGATVGGSSMINAMVTYLPPDSDWNYIANLTGDTSWGGSSMRTLFQNIEKNNYLSKETAGHGFDGWFQTNMQAGFTQDLALSRAEAAALGKDWPLTLRTNALATKILFNTNSTSCGGVLKATGVEYLTGQSVYKADPRNNGAAGTKATARARKEVIVAGGTFNTPQLLQLSGIGPASLLTSLNIPVLVDSPGVGANLQDNQEMPVVGVSKNGQGSGAGYTFIKTNHSVTGERDLWMMHGGPFRGFWPPSTRLSNRPGPQDAAGTLSMSMVKQHVANRAGSVRITSTDPRDPPEINFRLYTQGRETDMGAVKDFVAWARRVHKATAAPVGPISTIEPPCPSGQDADGSCGQADEDWIEGQTFGHHCTSTAAIGAEGDANAVLDSKFRVRGVSGLRVADASVFPKIPGIFPAVATFMVGQKAVKRPVVWASTIQTTTLFVNNFVGVYYVPIYCQAVRGVGPSRSGVYTLPSILTQLLSLVATGALADWIGYQILFGLRGMGLQMGIIAVQNAVTLAQSPTVIAFMVFVENLVAAIFTIVGNVAFTQTLTRRGSVLAPSVSPGVALAVGGGAEAVRALLPPGSPELDGLLLAFSDSVNAVFYLLTALAVVSFTAAWGMGWVDIRKKGAVEDGA
ncbi:hypothetical protein LA080_006423 [Diaporthe eres]|nr:hypothetical protein LA080_006423 [Diaporthe eres]